MVWIVKCWKKILSTRRDIKFREILRVWKLTEIRWIAVVVGYRKYTPWYITHSVHSSTNTGVNSIECSFFLFFFLHVVATHSVCSSSSVGRLNGSKISNIRTKCVFLLYIIIKSSSCTYWSSYIRSDEVSVNVYHWYYHIVCSLHTKCGIALCILKLDKMT